jgi:hypothetical protein
MLSLINLDFSESPRTPADEHIHKLDNCDLLPQNESSVENQGQASSELDQAGSSALDHCSPSPPHENITPESAAQNKKIPPLKINLAERKMSQQTATKRASVDQQEEPSTKLHRNIKSEPVDEPDDVVNHLLKAFYANTGCPS